MQGRGVRLAERKRRLNAFPRLWSVVDGSRVHYVHSRADGGGLPVLVRHGWPGSLVQMLDLLPLLVAPTDHGGAPADAFDVVVGSLPGFGSSQASGDLSGTAPRADDPPADPSPAIRRYIDDVERWRASEVGYGAIQATKPQTLAASLNDSPAGLAAWIVEKFRRWSDCDGDVERRFTKDQLLTNISVYCHAGFLQRITLSPACPGR